MDTAALADLRAWVTEAGLAGESETAILDGFCRRAADAGLPIARAMPRMLRELEATPNIGFLGFHTWLGNPTITLQYWRSFDDLEQYAKDATRLHRPAWASFNRAVASNGDVGIWHETYRVRPGDFECIYNNTPPFGLAKATKCVPALGRRESAAGRMLLRP